MFQALNQALYVDYLLLPATLRRKWWESTERCSNSPRGTQRVCLETRLTPKSKSFNHTSASLSREGCKKNDYLSVQVSISSWMNYKLLDGRDHFLPRCFHNVSVILYCCKKCDRLGGLNNGHLFLRLEVGDQGGASLVRSLLRALFLVMSSHGFPWGVHAERDRFPLL